MAIKKTPQRIWFYSLEVSYNFSEFSRMKRFLSRISKGEIANLETLVVFSKNYAINLHLFSGIAQCTDKKPISDKIFINVQSWITLFFIFSSSWPFNANIFPVSILIYGVMHELYISWLGSHSNHSKYQMHSYLAVCHKKKTLYDSFLWTGFNCLKAKATSRRQLTFYH